MKLKYDEHGILIDYEYFQLDSNEIVDKMMEAFDIKQGCWEKFHESYTNRDVKIKDNHWYNCNRIRKKII